MGIEQSKQSERISALSILAFHDSIEMFLKLLAEHLNIKSENFSFLQYWTEIPKLTLKESMRSFNTIRVNIKHKGLSPSKSDIEKCRVNATDFFEQNTSIQFGIDFKDISLLTLIQYPNVRQRLEEAQKNLDENQIENCIENAAIAFDELISSYEDSKSEYYEGSPFFFGKDLTSHGSLHIGIDRFSSSDIERKLGEFVDKVKESFEGIQKAIKIMSFGIDYKKFTKFKLLTPIVGKMQGGRYAVELWGKKKWTKENCQYCIDFVLDSSLKLQEFDFDINELIEETKATVLITENKGTI